jgi:alpha-glucuronidase
MNTIFRDFAHSLTKYRLVLLICLFGGQNMMAVNGSDLWLANKSSKRVVVQDSLKTPMLQLAAMELQNGWQGRDGASFKFIIKKDKSLKEDGFRLDSTSIQSNSEAGILYGVFDLLRRQQTNQPIQNILSNPSYEIRILNHWDNPNGSIERGYAGRSFFWRGGGERLSVTEADRLLWQKYARANASIGINGAVLNNVNANPQALSADFLQRTKAIANELRPFGIKVYLSINFSSPTALGKLKTSDPLNPDVINWWNLKVKEVYQLIPDFGGFLVKANSEGLPGPQDFGRTHADGANMLADALKPFGGIVMWRAFVYSPTDNDRAKQAYIEFTPLDGVFRDNVIIQVKNGPIDFQPREPFSPLFGALKKTSVMAELQITQEYLGHSMQLVFLATMWEECLQSDTYQKGSGSTVAKCTDGSLFKQTHTAISGVANSGLDTDWCGNTFAQSNWYAFGRLAWDNNLKSEQIAMEWLQQTFSPDQATSKNITAKSWQKSFLSPVCQMMLQSRETTVNYSMPLGLHHLFSAYEHYGPGPWYAPARVRKDWTPPYYHQADILGIGFDRTSKGSDAVSQYQEPLRSTFENVETCPENLLLWFHHIPWTYRMKSGQQFWDEMCRKYNEGVNEVRGFQKTWDQMQPYVDNERFLDVQRMLCRQTRDAQIWKDGCILYFQQFSKMPIPYGVERPVYDLDVLLKMNMLNP